MEKKLNIEIIEIFMAKCGKGNKGFDRRFHGTIKRGTDENGNPMVYGKIKINDGFIYSMASSQLELGDMLDEMVVMILDKGLHSDAGITAKICDTDFFLN